MSEAKVIRWGILATGGIAKSFTKDLLVDPKTRDVHNIKHDVVAAASSSSASRASDFLKDVGAPLSAKAYGAYTELVQDPSVDIIYIATPHSHHYQNTMLCLNAGKHVLCEKPFTANAAQLRILIDKAREKNLFLMEAVWTRYFPLSIYIRSLIASGRLGNVARVSADLSAANDPEKNFPDGKNRNINPDLAGGALLDRGIYSLTWCFQTLYDTQPPSAPRTRPSVISSLKPYAAAPGGAADEMTTMVLTFPRPAALGGDAHAIATTSLRVSSDPDGKGSAGPAVRIQGDKGEAIVFPPIYRPTRTRVVLRDGTVEHKTWKQPGPGKGSGFYNGFGGTFADEGEGHGMFWEADEAASAIVEGRKEGRFQSLENSLLILEIMDEVRRQGGLVYPDKVETTDYPVEM